MNIRKSPPPARPIVIGHQSSPPIRPNTTYFLSVIQYSQATSNLNPSLISAPAVPTSAALSILWPIWREDFTGVVAVAAVIIFALLGRQTIVAVEVGALGECIGGFDGGSWDT